MDLWIAGCAGSRLTTQAWSPMDKPWKTLRVSHRLPTGRRLPTSSTGRQLQSSKSGKVKTISPVLALAYSAPVAVQATVTTANGVRLDGKGKLKGAGEKPVSAEQMELARLRAELARVKMERDILKKATAYFARESS